jgi:hypothetical protein
MGHLDIRTYEKKKLDRKNEEKQVLGNDRTQSADMMYHENDDLSSNEIEPAAPVGKKKGHKVACEQYSTTEIVS